MTWEKVNLHNETFEDTPFNFNGTYLSIGKGQKVFQCKSDVPTTCAEALVADDGTNHIPAYDESFSPERANALPTSRQAKHINNSSRHFEVTVNFADPTGGQPEEDLLALPAKISSTGINGTEEYTTDAEDTPVRNSAGEPFDQFPQRLTSGRVYTIEKYVNASTKADIQASEHTNNSGAMTIDGFVHDENTLLLNNASFETFGSVYKATITITYNPREWTDKPLNVGFSELDAGERRDITQKDADDNDVPVTKPWPLNPDGTKMASPTDVPDELTFYPYPLNNWVGVPLS